MARVPLKILKSIPKSKKDHDPEVVVGWSKQDVEQPDDGTAPECCADKPDCGECDDL